MDSSERRFLVTGGASDRFLPHLLSSIERANRIDIAVAFVKSTGMRLIFDALSAARLREPPAEIRFLTSDYLDVTDPEALRDLVLLSQQGLEARLFRTAETGFHLKAYLFGERLPDGSREAWAYVGSSNLSRDALTATLEWNLRVERATSGQAVLEIAAGFERLWHAPESAPLSDALVRAYQARRRVPTVPVAPGSADAEEGVPSPLPVQVEALEALRASRAAGSASALVVMATGLGKTYLAAFDAKAFGAGRVLFVAHREEILAQAARTFLRVFPSRRVGMYASRKRDAYADLVFASVQTLARTPHLERFDKEHFDYIVVDEFHHAAASTYRRVIDRFSPIFLLGLTATPDRTDAADIRALCDHNEVFTFNLFAAVADGYLCPFTYYGIHDAHVNYEEIPWRNGRFDPTRLENALATINRANHAYAEWQSKRQRRTLAFCVSRRHADFMAERFSRHGVRAAAVHGDSEMDRAQALELLTTGALEVVFSVDLFSEGVDLPLIDTIMMLRPTESRVMFLQQLGRGLRQADGKDRLVILDFIGNHHSFLAKPQAILGIEPTTSGATRFLEQYDAGELDLPDGCFVNVDLEVINFLRSLHRGASRADYQVLRDALQRRPTALEFYRSGASLPRVRREHGSWFGLVHEEGDLEPAEQSAADKHAELLTYVERTKMVRSFKMVLLDAFLGLQGFATPPTVRELAAASLAIFRRRRSLVPDLGQEIGSVDTVTAETFHAYWGKNPVNALIGGNLATAERAPFRVEAEQFRYRHPVAPELVEPLSLLVRELIELRLAQYADRPTSPVSDPRQVDQSEDRLLPQGQIEVPYFPNIPIACGHFRAGTGAPDEQRTVRGTGLRVDRPYFVARATGDSMSHGETPVRDQDHVLLEYLPAGAAIGSHETVVIEDPSLPGDARSSDSAARANQASYVLRQWHPTAAGAVRLIATNPAYETMTLTASMRPIARLVRVVDPLEFRIGHSFTRDEIPSLFGTTFNLGNWNSGHVSLLAAHAVVLLVTLNKQGKAAEHRYVDRWESPTLFHWQSQNSTTPGSKRGRELINHEANGTAVHLFDRERKLGKDGKAAPFVYRGRVRYLGHSGSAPMSVR